jgi:hypothetical protein
VVSEVYDIDPKVQELCGMKVGVQAVGWRRGSESKGKKKRWK